MEFTGSLLTAKRNFYTQTGNFGVAVNCLVGTSTGTYRFGVSGAQGVFEFTLQSGKLYQDGNLIHSYQANREFGLQLQFASGSYNVFKSAQPMVFGLPKATGSYDYFYFSRESTGIAAEFDVWVSGDSRPDYTIQDVGYLIASGQEAVTGQISNRGSYPLRIFDASALNSQGLAFGLLTQSVNPASSGAFAYSGSFDGFNFDVPILTTFNTNYSDLNVNFLIQDLRSYSVFVILDPIGAPVFTDGEWNSPLSYTNYSGGFQTDGFNTSLFFRLQYVSGSGSFTTTFADSAQYLTTGYGSFLQSGTLTGIATIATGNDTVTGNYVVMASQFSWATGAATGRFSLWGVGMASGIGYTGLAASTFTGMTTGYVYNGSGTLQLNQYFSGIAASPALSVGYTGYTNATGYVNITNLQQDDYFYIGVESVPLIKGLQFTNQTGLVYYLSGAPAHKVNSYTDGTLVYLSALTSGTDGNGVFVRSGQCNFSAISFSPWLTGGQNVGTTGNSVVPIGLFSGYANLTITGSGTYRAIMEGNAAGLFYYTRTFTGAWDLLTGTTSATMVSLKGQGQYSSTMISGSGDFQPNSTINFQVNHDSDGVNVDAAILTISGSRVVNGIVQYIEN